MYQSGRAGDEAKKRKSPTKSGRVGIYESGKQHEEVEGNEICFTFFLLMT